MAVEPCHEGIERPIVLCVEGHYLLMEHSLRTGPAEELRWFVAETDALSRMRPEVDAETRERIIEETKHWVMRDLRSAHAREQNGGAPHSETPERFLFRDLFEKHDEAAMERWGSGRWEAATLQALWRICRDGVVGHAPARSLFQAVRHRDYLLEATNVDSDLLVNEILIRFCAAFTDQGFADWALPNRNQGVLS